LLLDLKAPPNNWNHPDNSKRGFQVFDDRLTTGTDFFGLTLTCLLLRNLRDRFSRRSYGTPSKVLPSVTCEGFARTPFPSPLFPRLPGTSAGSLARNPPADAAVRPPASRPAQGPIDNVRCTPASCFFSSVFIRIFTSFCTDAVGKTNWNQRMAPLARDVTGHYAAGHMPGRSLEFTVSTPLYNQPGRRE